MECQPAFEKLKHLSAAEPVLKYPDLDKPFVIQADASNVAVGAMILQKNWQGGLQPCAYTLCKLSNAERYWAVWEKEVYGIRWALLAWRQFLERSKVLFEVWADYKNLELLKKTQKANSQTSQMASILQLVQLHPLLSPQREEFPGECPVQDVPVQWCQREVVNSIIPFKQIAAPALTRQYKASKEQT